MIFIGIEKETTMVEAQKAQAADLTLRGVKEAVAAADRWKDRYDEVVTGEGQPVDVEVVDGLVAELMVVLALADDALELWSQLGAVTPETTRRALLQMRSGMDTVMAEVATTGVWMMERYFRRVQERNPEIDFPVSVRLDLRRGSRARVSDDAAG